MRKFLLIAILIGVANADDDAHAHVAKDYRAQDKHGNFKYGFEATNGIGADEAGDAHEVHGQYHFISKEGVPVKVSYTADEHGYHPHSELLPKSPPIPEAIQRSLKYLETHPNHDDGKYHPHRNDHQNVQHNVQHDQHNLHQDSHRNVQHNVHQNVQHVAQHNVHQDSHRNVHQNVHQNTHASLRSAHPVSHHNVHHDNHRNVHHNNHQNSHRNNQHNKHHGSQHSGHH